MTRTGTFLLLMAWPGTDFDVIARNMSIQECAGQYAMARIADSRWLYRCELVTTSAFRLFRIKPIPMLRSSIND
jgi:hypothetical protein